MLTKAGEKRGMFLPQLTVSEHLKRRRVKATQGCVLKVEKTQDVQLQDMVYLQAEI